MCVILNQLVDAKTELFQNKPFVFHEIFLEIDKRVRLLIHQFRLRLLRRNNQFLSAVTASNDISVFTGTFAHFGGQKQARLDNALDLVLLERFAVVKPMQDCLSSGNCHLRQSEHDAGFLDDKAAIFAEHSLFCLA